MQHCRASWETCHEYAPLCEHACAVLGLDSRKVLNIMDCERPHLSGYLYVYGSQEHRARVFIAVRKHLVGIGIVPTDGIQENRGFTRIASLYLVIDAIRRGFPVSVAERALVSNVTSYGHATPLFA